LVEAGGGAEMAAVGWRRQDGVCGCGRSGYRVMQCLTVVVRVGGCSARARDLD
jgi:hypothetical protein